MNTNNIENTDSEIVEGEEEVIENESAEDKAERLENSNKQLFSRLKKAEGFELKDGKWVKPEVKPEIKPEVKKKSSQEGLTSSDVFVLVKNNIPEEDVEEVVEYAALKNISISEALKTNVVKTILADKAEQRKVADGTNTNGGRRSSSRLSDEALIANADKGTLPENEEDIKRLILARRAKK